MQDQELDPRVQNLYKWAKIGGVALVAVAASTVIIVGSLSVIAAGALALGALAMVNFAIPVGARWLALKKQQSLTALAEQYSEETIREDERKEAERVESLEEQYAINRSSLEGAQEELRNQLESATPDEQDMLNGQIQELQRVIDNAEATLRQRKVDFAELQRVNKLYIAFHRSAAAMEKSQGAERDPEELQRLETARTAIKTRMRQQLAGKTIEAMNAEIKGRRSPTAASVARLGVSKPIPVIPVTGTKEVSRVPDRR